MEQKPIRIQRKRTKGWKMPENTVSVTRPGKYGNPFKVGRYYKVFANGWFSPCHPKSIEEALIDPSYTLINSNEDAVIMYKKYLSVLETKPDFSELRGKNLACFCALQNACHADVLLEVANS